MAERVLTEAEVGEAGARWLWILVKKLVDDYDVRAMSTKPANQLEMVVERYLEWGWVEPDWDVMVDNMHVIELCVSCEAFPLAAMLATKGKCNVLTEETKWTVAECVGLLDSDFDDGGEMVIEELPVECEYFGVEWQSRASYFMDQVIDWYLRV
jgi:hypothetical protein